MAKGTLAELSPDPASPLAVRDHPGYSGFLPPRTPPHPPDPTYDAEPWPRPGGSPTPRSPRAPAWSHRPRLPPFPAFGHRRGREAKGSGMGGYEGALVCIVPPQKRGGDTPSPHPSWVAWGHVCTRVRRPRSHAPALSRVGGRLLGSVLGGRRDPPTQFREGNGGVLPPTLSPRDTDLVPRMGNGTGTRHPPSPGHPSTRRGTPIPHPR